MSFLLVSFPRLLFSPLLFAVDYPLEMQPVGFPKLKDYIVGPTAHDLAIGVGIFRKKTF
jgi:hypothetical protein